MYTLAQAIHFLFPIIALIFLIVGLYKNSIYYVISSLWLSLISLIILYKSFGSQLFGDSFDYLNAGIYTLNLLILITSLIRIISHLSVDKTVFRYLSSFVKSLIIIGCLLVITNVWINAYFIENRMPGTPIMQVATFSKADYCAYRYTFYKVAKNGTVMYLCPNHYGLIPSIGRLAISPDFIASQLSPPNKKKSLLLQQKKVKVNSDG